MVTRVDILGNALEQVTGRRETDYGTPEDNFSKISKLWSAYLGIDISAVDVAMLMSLLKIARIRSGHGGTNDCFVDLAGYAACGGEIVSKKKSEGVVPAPLNIAEDEYESLYNRVKCYRESGHTIHQIAELVGEDETTILEVVTMIERDEQCSH